MAVIEASQPVVRTDYGLLRFEEVFKTHFKELHAYAYTLVKEDLLAEEMVQQVFFKLWEKKDSLKIESSATAYLYRSVYHECLNYLKHQKVKSAYLSYAKTATESSTGSASQKIQLSELQKHLNKALSELPEQCRTIFQMSRYEELKYQEIADRLGLSVKTIENQMGKALRLLREKLKDFLPLLLLILLNL
ncbi:RNA polymerase sigma-70 factor [Flavihumibacter sp. UBA7668]|uniref:RNA polymerase sigma-70 factor n=1 Tax=Flavihumibacter sp. UBA7668 TaxID=1946542 RepID=UPI0025BC958C|nr:RNA polymerase sigma-70 factor [Flavihumibacter sp. UBA7668]